MALVSPVQSLLSVKRPVRKGPAIVPLQLLRPALTHKDNLKTQRQVERLV